MGHDPSDDLAEFPGATHQLWVIESHKGDEVLTELHRKPVASRVQSRRKLAGALR